MSLELLIPLGVCALLSMYSYLFYPLILLVTPDWKQSGIRTASDVAKISFIITAHNEEQKIAQKIKNSLELRQAIPDLEIIVASDASSDKTDDIVAGFAAQDVNLVRSPERNGKEFAQNLAIDQSCGEIIVFTDVGTKVAAGSVERLIELFRDSSIGAVSSEDSIISSAGNVVGEGLYVRYEMWLRRLESRKGSLIGLSGSFFATRRQVAQLWDTDIPSDFSVAISARKMGYRSVSDRHVIGEYHDVERSGDEVSRKIRTVIRGMTAVRKKTDMLNPSKHGLFAFQLFSHKVMRWMVPWFVLAYTVLATAFSLKEPIFMLTLLPLLILMVPVVVVALSSSARHSAWVGPIFYLLQTNLAVARAGVAFMSGRRITTWSPSRR